MQRHQANYKHTSKDKQIERIVILMKKLVLIVGLVMAFSGVANARPAYKKALGMKDCKECHEANFKEPSEKPLYKAAVGMVASMKKGEGDFAGKKDCNECHQGKQKPEKKG